MFPIKIQQTCCLLVFIAGLFFPAFSALADTDDNSLQQEYFAKRLAMVREQIEARKLSNPAVLDALKTVPRHRFVPGRYETYAYQDSPLPIGYGQAISQPFIVAYMTDSIDPQPRDKILEIGTGSGYQAAILAQIVDQVYSIEIVPQLAQRSVQLLNELGYTNIRCRQGDGYYGWPEQAPFDAIVVTAAAPYIPPPLLEQLKPGGKMVIPVGTPFRTQNLLLVEKAFSGKIHTRNLLPVRFVPLRRAP